MLHVLTSRFLYSIIVQFDNIIIIIFFLIKYIFVTVVDYIHQSYVSHFRLCEVGCAPYCDVSRSGCDNAEPIDYYYYYYCFGSPLFSAEDKNDWNCNSTPLYALWFREGQLYILPIIISIIVIIIQLISTRLGFINIRT